MLSTAVAYNPADGTSKRFSVPIVQELSNSNNLETLPERFIRSEDERPSVTNSPSQFGIPVIDMQLLLGQNGCSEEEMEKLAMACEEWGFFQVVNHGIPGSLMERTKEIAREFFQLPSEEKLKYAVRERQGYGQAFVVSDDQQLDWTDLLYLTLMPPEKRNMKFWPTIPVDFVQTVEEYALELQKLGNKILYMLAKNLGLQSPDCFVNKFGEISEAMHYYPPCPRPDLVLGLSAHSDGGGIAILLQDDAVVGLHVRKDGQWIPAEPIPGGLVVNIGDMVEVISNGRYKSIEHRAVTNKEKGRISVAAFCNLGEEAEVGPAAELINESNPCNYRTFKHSDYLRNYFSSKLEGKKAIEFAKLNPSSSG
jgi:isopenicillin N synthase-like dioxygenase